MTDFLDRNVLQTLNQITIKYDIDKLNGNVRKLKLSNFKKYINFEVDDLIIFS